MATYYTMDCAVEDFVQWCAKCQHYGMDPRKVILFAEKENSFLYGEDEDNKED